MLAVSELAPLRSSRQESPGQTTQSPTVASRPISARAMFCRLSLLVAATAALPLPQLTQEEFLAPAASARARSLDDPQDVFITSSYAQVGRQSAVTLWLDRRVW